MERIELHQRLLGGGLVGHVETKPALSWSEHDALVSGAETTRRAAAALGQIGYSLDRVAANVASLERTLGFGMEQQADLLTRQAETLDELSAALRTPAKTRAAERLIDVAELLRRERWEPALALASEATKDDPNNPEAFQAAAWAQLALGEMSDARDLLVEAALAADGVPRSRNGRQAARATLVTTGPSDALATLERFGLSEPLPTPDTALDDGDFLASVDSWVAATLETGATDLDRAVYLCELTRASDAVDALRRSGDASPEFYAAALLDPILSADEALRAVAEDGLPEAHARAQSLHIDVRAAVSANEGLSAELADCINAVGDIPSSPRGPDTARNHLTACNDTLERSGARLQALSEAAVPCAPALAGEQLVGRRVHDVMRAWLARFDEVEELERRAIALARERKAVPERIDYDEWRVHL
jgi:tetratricopeptide (TPR) repeat protein